MKMDGVGDNIFAGHGTLRKQRSTYARPTRATTFFNRRRRSRRRRTRLTARLRVPRTAEVLSLTVQAEICFDSHKHTHTRTEHKHITTTRQRSQNSSGIIFVGPNDGLMPTCVLFASRIGSHGAGAWHACIWSHGGKIPCHDDRDAHIRLYTELTVVRSVTRVCVRCSRYGQVRIARCARHSSMNPPHLQCVCKHLHSVLFSSLCRCVYLVVYAWLHTGTWKYLFGALNHHRCVGAIVRFVVVVVVFFLKESISKGNILYAHT